MTDMLFPKAALAAACLALASCSSTPSWMPDIKMPKLPKMAMPKMPDLTAMKKILPGSEDSVSADDPQVSFDPRRPLSPGHTLRVRVFSGVRSGKDIFNGLALVDPQGVAAFDKFGAAKLGGRPLPDAVRMIESVFRVTRHAASTLTVHIVSVENVRLVSVAGDAAAPQHVPLQDGMKFSDAVSAAGGRKAGSRTQAVYLVRDGVRQFHRWIGALDESASPQPGDIILLSSDL